MSQHDMQVDNQGFPSFRADMNNALKALASAASGDTQPTTRYPNQLWADTANNLLKIRNTANTLWRVLGPLDGIHVADTIRGRLSSDGALQDLTVAQVTALLDIQAPTATSGIPTGALLDFGAASVPAGFLACDGDAISRLTFAQLFSVIGTTWGVGDGSTTFNVPDFRRRVAVGSGGAGSAELGNAVGDVGGEETHQLTLGELPAHSHSSGSLAASSGGSHSHSSGSLSASSGGSHSHTLPQESGGSQNLRSVTTNSGSDEGYGSPSTGSAGSHSHSISGSTSSSGSHSHSISGSTGSAGDDEAHNTMQPSAVVARIIKT